MDGITNGLSGLKVDQCPVYLLKTKSSPADSYEEHFEKSDNGHFKPIFVPVLEHRFMDDALRALKRHAERFAFAGGSEADHRRKATNNPAKRYGGIVFTSQRAVDAFASIIAKLEPSKLNMHFDKNTPLYVVGPATARGVKALNLPCPVVGEETGNGEALAKFIQAYHETLSPEVTHLNGRKLPLLFLVGDQRRDIIPKTLESEHLSPAQRIQVQEVVVYETGEMATFEEDFMELLRAAKTAKVKEQWVLVFSPQGCGAMLNALGWLEEKTAKFSAAQRDVMMGPMKTRIATIGPTTRDFLKEEFAFEPDVCAAQPSPEGVVEAISQYREP